MSYSEKWEQTKAARQARRAADPVIQDRARQHAARAAREAEKAARKRAEGDAKALDRAVTDLIVESFVRLATGEAA